MTMNNDVSWRKLRSDIYIRDKGICWICNTFVDLSEYELGHLIDRCNGGNDVYDNLAVMHMDCNRAKPYHNSLEEAMRWKLTAFIHPNHNDTLRISRIDKKAQMVIPIKAPRLHRYLNRKYISEDDRIKNIKPSTLCWIQGRPVYRDCGKAPMWVLLPPPYRKEDKFILRQIPPGATDNGGNGIYETLQILNGVLLAEVDIDLGCIHYHIFSVDGKLKVICSGSAVSNSGIPSQTIGMGISQIPINAWLIAKSQGIKLSDFKKSYALKSDGVHSG